MKECPHCNDLAIYDDSIEKCPLCGTRLVDFHYSSEPHHNNSQDQAPVFQTDPVSHVRERYEAMPQFERRTGRQYVFRGLITEIHPQSRLHNRPKKLVNSIFRGEPYQFGNTSQGTIFRVEQLHNAGFAYEKRDCIFYGDVEGRFNYGDDVTVTTKRVGDRYIVKSMMLNETNTPVRPGFQIPAGLVRFGFFLFLILAIVLVAGVVMFFAGGGLGTIFDTLLSIVLKLLPYILVGAVVIFLIRALIRGRFR